MRLLLVLGVGHGVSGSAYPSEWKSCRFWVEKHEAQKDRIGRPTPLMEYFHLSDDARTEVADFRRFMFDNGKRWILLVKSKATIWIFQTSCCIGIW